MRDFEVFFNPRYEMILACSLNGLVEEVWGEEFVNICSWEVSRKRLGQTVKTHLGVKGRIQLTKKLGTIPWPVRATSPSD